MSDVIEEELENFTWHHSIDLGNGIVTSGHKKPAVCKAEGDMIFDRLDVSGRSVLDIGAWNGFFSFEAKQRGAGRVLATDSHCWTNPKIRGRESFELARSALGLDIEAQQIDAGKISQSSVGEFDVVMYLGVFYHRRDAIESLPRIASSAKEVLVVETQLDLLDVDKPALAYYPADELRGDSSNWWGPNALFMKDFLLGMGFAEVEVSAHPTHKLRGFFHAYRSADMRRGPLLEDHNFTLGRAVGEPEQAPSKVDHTEVSGPKSFWDKLRGR